MQVSEQLEAATTVGESLDLASHRALVYKSAIYDAIPEIKAMEARLERLEAAARHAHRLLRLDDDNKRANALDAADALDAALAGQPSEGEA